MPTSTLRVSIGSKIIELDFEYQNEQTLTTEARAFAKHIANEGFVDVVEDGSYDSVYYPAHRVQSISWSPEKPIDNE